MCILPCRAVFAGNSESGLTTPGGRGRERAYLTCHDAKVDMYRKMGFEDIGVSASVWGGSPWREMRADLGSLRGQAQTDADTIA